jgi:hypothetical protein
MPLGFLDIAENELVSFVMTRRRNTELERQ